MPPEPPRNRSHQRPSIRKRPPRRHGQQRSSRRPFSGARHLPGNPIGPPPKRRISPEPPLSGRRTGRAQSQNLRGVFRQPFETVPKPIRIRPLRHRPKNLFPEPDTEPPTLEKHPPVPVLKPSTRAASQDSPRAGPEKPPEEPVPRAEHSPPQKSSPAPPAEPTKQIRNESVEHAASVQTKCVQAKGNAQKEMRKAKRNTPKRKATPQNASFRPAICRPETSANAAPGPCGGGGARRATPASSRRRCPYPYRWTAALRCGRRSPAVCRPVRAAFCPEARNSPRRGRPSSPAYCPAARSP